MEIKREHHINFWYVVLAMLVVMLIQDFMVQALQIKIIPYPEFRTSSIRATFPIPSPPRPGSPVSGSSHRHQPAGAP